MTTDNQSGNAPSISNQEELAAALQKELGQAAGYLDLKYREWCIQHPDEVISLNESRDAKIQEVQNNRTVLKRIFDLTTSNYFDDYFSQYPSETICSKNNKIAKEFREKGNKAYQNKQNYEAIQLYTKSLQYSETGTESETLALAYANRSAVLLALGKDNDVEAALRDIQRALISGYPKDMQHKLYERKGKCFTKLKQYQNADKAYKDALTKVGQANMIEEKKIAFAKGTEKLILQLRDLILQSKAVHKPEQDLKSVKTLMQTPKLTCPNKIFPDFSVSLNLAYKEQVGRHVVASRDIRSGEILAVEDPAISFLNLDERGAVKFGSCCTHCLIRNLDCLPSPLTNCDVFCSETCLEEAMNSYHQVESTTCNWVKECGAKTSEGLLAYRAITQKPFEYFLNNETELFCEHDPKYGTKLKEGENVYGDGDVYKSYFNLVTMDDKVPSNKRHFRGFVTFFLVHCLSRAGYFKSEDINHKLMIGNLLMHFWAVAAMNCHEVAELRASDDLPQMQGNLQCIGSSLEASLDLINHSCVHNVLRFNCGRSTVLVACQDIKEGEEVTDCYYSSYFESPKEIRQAALGTKYHFSCHCQACNSNWPTAQFAPKALVDIPDDQLMFSTDDVRNAKLIFERINKLGTKIALEQKNEDYDKVLTYGLEFLKLLKGSIKPPHNFYVMTLRSIAKCLWITKGSVFLTPV